MLQLLATLLLMAGGTPPAAGDTRFDAVGRLNTYCTAVLVRPDVVLTARHCLAEGQPHRVSFRNGEEGVVTGFYLPEGGDAALGFLKAPVEAIQPIPMAATGAAPGTSVVLAGTGLAAELGLCASWVTWSAPESYIGFPAFDDQDGPGCGPESGDSGGAVIVGGRALRVLGVIVGRRDATNLQRYEADAIFSGLLAARRPPRLVARAARP